MSELGREKEKHPPKLGLVWEKQEEMASEFLMGHIPFFKEVDEIRQERESPCHFLLEGENLHSLTLLQETHRGKIDVIYIDPPYNTRKKDFRYNDDYVAQEDGYKHSKWLSFMEKRLELAKQLLSHHGVLFVSIGEQEQAHLNLLLHEIFGEHHYLVTLPRISSKSGKTAEAFSKNHDYVLVYTRREQDMLLMETYEDQNYKEFDEFQKERGNYRLNQPLDYDSLSYSKGMDYPITLEGEVFYPGGCEETHKKRLAGEHRRADWAWRWCRELFEFGLEHGFVVLKRKRDGTARIYTKTYEKAGIELNKMTNTYEIVYKEAKSKAVSSLSLVENECSNAMGKKDLKKFHLGEEFDYAKPVELVKRLIKSHENKEAVVLDFFAGSGTTAQAVLELNQEDGGNRHFILCTDDQKGICEKICYPRLQQLFSTFTYRDTVEDVLFQEKISMGMLRHPEKLQAVLKECDTVRKSQRSHYDSMSKVIMDDSIVLLGKKIKKVEGGFSGNLSYFAVDYVKKGSSQVEQVLMEHIRPMIALEYGYRADGDVFPVFLNEDEVDEFMGDEYNLRDCKGVYLADSVLLLGKQSRMLARFGIPVRRIPHCYFSQWA